MMYDHHGRRGSGLPRWTLRLLPLLLLSAPVSAQEATLVLPLGTVLPGIGAITRLDGMVINARGDWLVHAKTDQSDPDRDQVLLRGGAPYQQEGDALGGPAGATIDSFGPFDLDDSGNLYQVLYLSGTGGTAADVGLYRNGSPLILEGAASSAPQFSGGTTYRGFLNVRVNAAGTRLALVAAVDDPAIPTSLDLAVLRVDVDPSGNVTGETAVAYEGMVLPGQTQPVRSLGTGRHQLDLNDSGQIIFFADLAGPTGTDGAVYIDGTLVAQEGGVAPGGVYQELASRGVAIDAAGGHALRALLGPPVTTATDDVLIQNGAVLAQEGDLTLNPPLPFPVVSFGAANSPLLLDNAANLVWFARTGFDFSGLGENGAALVVQAFGTVGGQPVQSIASAPGKIARSKNAEWTLFQVRTPIAEGVALFASVVDAPLPLRQHDDFLEIFPNPVRDRVRIRFSLERPAEVRLDAYDVAGRLVATLDRGVRAAGEHLVDWTGTDANGRRVVPGTYFLRLRAGDRDHRSRVTLVQ